MTRKFLLRIGNILANGSFTERLVVICLIGLPIDFADLFRTSFQGFSIFTRVVAITLRSLMDSFVFALVWQFFSLILRSVRKAKSGSDEWV